MGPNKGGGKAARQQAKQSNSNGPSASKPGGGGGSQKPPKPKQPKQQGKGGDGKKQGGGGGGGGGTGANKGAGGGGGGGGKATGHGPAVGMSVQNMALVQQLLASGVGDAAGAGAGQGGGGGGGGGGPRSSSPAVRSGVDQAGPSGPSAQQQQAADPPEAQVAQLRDLVTQDMMKKGFARNPTEAAWAAAHQAALQGGDYAQPAFSRLVKAVAQRALEWLLINVPEGQLPAAFRVHSNGHRPGGGGGGLGAGDGGGKGPEPPKGGTSKGPSARPPSAPPCAPPPRVLSQSPAEAAKQAVLATTAALFAAGLDGAEAKAAAARHPHDPTAALLQLCNAMRPSVDDARACMSGAGAWVGDVPPMVATEMETMAQILGPEGQFGCCRDATQIELSAPVEGLDAGGKLEVSFDPRGLYPFEPPQRLLFRHPTLPFHSIAALTVGAWRQSVKRLCGAPQLFELLVWLRGSGAEVAEKARQKYEKVMNIHAGADGGADGVKAAPSASGARPSSAAGPSAGVASLPRPESAPSLAALQAAGAQQQQQQRAAGSRLGAAASAASAREGGGGSGSAGLRGGRAVQQAWPEEDKPSAAGAPPAVAGPGRPAGRQQQQQQQQAAPAPAGSSSASAAAPLPASIAALWGAAPEPTRGASSPAASAPGSSAAADFAMWANSAAAAAMSGLGPGSGHTSGSAGPGPASASAAPAPTGKGAKGRKGAAAAAAAAAVPAGAATGPPVAAAAAAAPAPAPTPSERAAQLKRAWEADVARNAARRSAELSAALERWQTSQEPKVAAMRSQRERLPAWALQGAVLETTGRAQVCVISGETGCGKTTQVPQFLLDAAIRQGNGGMTGIVCTQPRRISATSVAQRVAAERNEALGKTVGYAIRMESVRSQDTRLLFCTTGVLVRRLIDDPLLVGTTCVVVDEVHERSLDSDFLLVLLKQLLPKRPDLKLILMSATVNERKFSSYFGGCPILQIPGFTHPVKEYYLEDVLKMTKYVPEPNSDYTRKGGASAVRDAPGMPKGSAKKQLEAELAAAAALSSKGYPEHVVSAMKTLDPEKINFDLMVAIICWIISNGEPGALLIFMPGLMEITKLHEACLACPPIRGATAGGQLVIALHSTLASADQSVAFDRAPEGVRKIVIATNIAETSITIDDVVWVIDTGRVKENRYSAETHMQALVECWVSRASARQRRGRAGRVTPGHCIRLFSRYTHDSVMQQDQIPEILRVPLESLVLQVKLLRVAGSNESVKGFLNRAMEPPSDDAITAAMRALVTIGALDEAGQELTPLGVHLATLPVDVRVGKMLIYAAMLGCLDPIATIAAAMTSRSPFVSPFEKREEADKAKASFAAMRSDPLAVLAAYNGWDAARRQGRSQERKFVSDSFLSSRGLMAIREMKGQFRRLLREAGFVDKSSMGGGGGRGSAWADDTEEPPSFPGAADAHASNLLLVRAVLVAGLYPNVVRVDAKKGKEGAKGAPPGGKPSPPKLVALVQNQSGKSEEQSVQIHPCSVNFGCTHFESPWLVYAEIVQTSAVYLRDCTMVTPYPLLLFGGSIQVQLAQGTVSIDGWIKLHCSPKVAVLFKEVRSQLERLLQDKIERPSLDLWESGGPVISTILQLITTEEGH